MAATSYEYSLSTDFPAGKVAEDRLMQEIDASGITSANYTHTDTAGDVCTIWFDDPLSPGDKTLLDGVVAAHSGDPLPYVEVVGGVVEATGLRLTEGEAPDQSGDIRLVSGAVQIRDATGTMNPRTHVAQHSVSDSTKHTSTATPGKLLKADASGLPSDATNTDTDVSDAVTKKHANTNDPTADEKAALAGTSGSPSGSNKFVTNDDPRTSDGRLPFYFQQANDDTTSSTSSSAWQDKVSLTTPSNFEAGTYKIDFYAECKCSLTNNLCAVCCRHIDADHDEYMGACDLDVGHDPSDVEVPFGGFKVISLTGGVHTFKIQYALSKGSGNVSIRKARMVLMRVA